MSIKHNGKTASTAAILYAAMLAAAPGAPAYARKSPYTRARPNTVLFGKAATTTSAPLNINTAGKPELSPLTPL